MNKQLYTLIFLFLLTFTSAYGEKDIVNKLTPNHLAITGTKISLIPPKGFTKASNFLGLQQEGSGSSILIVQLPGPFSQVSKGFTKEEIATKGIEASTIENLTFDMLPAVFISGTQKANGSIFTRYILVFGTEQETIMINGTFPQKLTAIGKEVKKSILTAYYESDRKVDPLSTVDFEINPNVANLKFASSMMSSLIYTGDGSFPPKSDDKTSLIVGRSMSAVKVDHRRQYALDRLRKFPLENIKIDTMTEVTIDGISGYEITAEYKEQKVDKPSKIEYVILYGDKSYYVFLGTTNVDFDSNIAKFQQAIRTFRRK